MPSPGSTTARGYGYEHQRLRAALLPQAYGQPCSRCGRPMERGQDPVKQEAAEVPHTRHGLNPRPSGRGARQHLAG